MNLRLAGTVLQWSYTWEPHVDMLYEEEHSVIYDLVRAYIFIVARFEMSHRQNLVSVVLGG